MPEDILIHLQRITPDTGECSTCVQYINPVRGKVPAMAAHRNCFPCTNAKVFYFLPKWHRLKPYRIIFKLNRLRWRVGRRGEEEKAVLFDVDSNASGGKICFKEILFWPWL